MTMTLDGPLALIGAGNMGGAMLAGWLSRGLDPKFVFVQDPGPPPAIAALLNQYKIPVYATLPNSMPEPAVLLVAVKPQVMEAVFPAAAKRAGPSTVVLSVAAGRTIASFAKHLPAATAIIRSIPNTPAAVGRGITVCCPNQHVTPAQRRLASDLLSAVGQVGWVEDESLIDAATAVSGSGPAYVFLLAECLAQAGVAAGLDQKLSRLIADATVSGAGELMHRSGEDPAVLRRNVTSPNGTTAAALDVLMAPGAMQEILTKAVSAATKRSRELSA